MNAVKGIAAGFVILVLVLALIAGLSSACNFTLKTAS